MEIFDVVVIGQGFSGLSASRLAIQRGLRTANLEANLTGGLIVNLNELDPVPAGAEHNGAELASGIAMANMDAGVVMAFEPVNSLRQGAGGFWQAQTDSTTYAARQVILASGARLRKLGIPGELEFFGQGVSECADCDGPMFQGQEAVIVGGGDSAFQEALALAQFASQVTIVMRGDTARARLELQERVAAHPNIALMPRSQVLAIQGTPGRGVESLLIGSAGQSPRTFPASGVFVFVGLEPNTGYLPAELALDAAGAVPVDERCATALPGLWAIGAVRSGFGGLLTDASADAERAVSALASPAGANQ